MDDSQLVDLIDGNLDAAEVEKLCRELLRFPTPWTEANENHPSLAAFNERLVLPYLREAGINQVKIDGLGNLYALGREGGDAALLLVGYAMTAAQGDMEDAFSGKVVEGEEYGLTGPCLWGRGACEQMGTLAAMLAGVALAKKLAGPQGIPVNLVVLASGETGRHTAIEYAMANDPIKARWALVDGPPRVQLGNMGRVDVIVRVKGKESHSSRPWEGVDAIMGARQVLDRLAPMIPYPPGSSHPQLGAATLTPTSIRSEPNATHTVQSLCEVRFDRRLLPGEEPEAAMMQIEEALEGNRPVPGRRPAG